MSNDSKKVSELTIATSLSANDRLVVLTNPSASAQTQTISLTDFANSVANSVANSIFRGPFASDAAAACSSINIGSPYYRPDGTVRIRLT